jgi:hypothetical protein
MAYNQDGRKAMLENIFLGLFSGLIMSGILVIVVGAAIIMVLVVLAEINRFRGR